MTITNEIVYVFTNEAMPGLVKIGRTNDLDGRMRELYKTGVPLPYECHYAVMVSDTDAAVSLEKKLHNLFAENRINKKREFFRVSPERVVIAMSIGDFTPVSRSLTDLEESGGDIEKVDIEAVEKEEKRRERLRLHKIGVPTGSILVFTRDESIVCTTLESGKIMFNGQETSLSAAARDILQTRYGLKIKSANGTKYWMFEGETLDERRERIESGEED